MSLPNSVPGPRLNIWRAWAVHLYTALGNIAGFLAVIAVSEHRARDVFLFLAISVLIDSTDGALARAWDIARWTPNFDGRKLDDITDYLTYVFIPIFFAYEFRLVSGPWTPVLGLVLLASAFGFCQGWAKTEDGFFTGFPSYWNIVVFYLYLLRAPVAFNGFFFLLLALLVFVPIRYVYPTKTRPLRALTLSLGALWGVGLVALWLRLDEPPDWLLSASLLYPVYYTILSLYLHFRRPALAAR
jgi:phosphatidylcholine synthase